MPEKVTLSKLIAMKKQGSPIAMLTCYDYATAVLLQEAGIDGIIVGDSLAQVVLGHPSTLSVTMDTMITLSAAVRAGAGEVFLVGDMPYMSYQPSVSQAISNAGRFMAEAACDAVKVEVDYRQVDLVAALSTAGIPVMAHLGYRPQSAGQSDKMIKTRQAQQAVAVIQDCQAMVQAGAMSILLECVTAEAAREVTKRVSVPIISCGSGASCDGQVLVLHDVLGLPGGSAPRFARTYSQVGDAIGQAAGAYIQDIHNGVFPDDEHSYHMPQGEQERFQSMLKDLPEPDVG